MRGWPVWVRWIMSVRTTGINSAKSFRLDTRAELRRGLLAACESCWVYAIVLTLTKMTRLPGEVSAVSIFLVYWTALEVGRYLPRMRLARQEWINLALAVLVILLVVRFDLYRSAPLLDISWVSLYVSRLSALFQTFTPDQVATAALIFVYVRGLGFAHRPLTLWFTGFEFRLGVVFFFAAAIVGAFAGGVDLRGVIIVYFIVSLLSIALARMEESGREMALGRGWAPLLLGACVLVVGLGFFVTPFLTISAAAAFFMILAPLAPPLQFVISLILIPLGYIIQLIIELLAPVMSVVAMWLSRMPAGVIPQNVQPLQNAANQGTVAFLVIWPYIRLVLFLALLMSAALVIARGLNRRMAQVEEETFARESAGEIERKRAEKMKRPRPAPSSQREIEAENIRRIYAALLVRCQVIGLPRREAETPFEFLPRLRARFPASAQDLNELTEAYVAVHYAQIPATRAQVQAMQAVWQRLKGKLKAEGGRLKTGDGGRKTD